jgi:predicted ATP-grasp superfamily ATP-dependent carboligase
LENIAENITFPVILKPFCRTNRWKKAKLPKAYHLSHIDDLRKVYSEIKKIEPRLVVQEWVQGDYSNVYYCLAYFSDKSECLAAFTKHKIRQWPVGMGSTATAAPKENQYVFEKTLEIFTDLKYKGFDSIEFKRHDINENYYLIEPTAGIINQQKYIAIINGINLLLRYYNFISGSNIEEKPPPEKNNLY